jgi:predicted DNA binding CopG/RHH family protein
MKGKNLMSDVKEKIKKVPHLRTDEEAEAFLSRDLSDLDFSKLTPLRPFLEKKQEQLNMRIEAKLLNGFKDLARARNIPYTVYVRELIKREVEEAAKVVSLIK